MSTYTIALATRLKRKVFRAGNIPVDVMEMIGDALRVNGTHLDGHFCGNTFRHILKTAPVVNDWRCCFCHDVRSSVRYVS